MSAPKDFAYISFIEMESWLGYDLWTCSYSIATWKCVLKSTCFLDHKKYTAPHAMLFRNCDLHLRCRIERDGETGWMNLLHVVLYFFPYDSCTSAFFKAIKEDAYVGEAACLLLLKHLSLVNIFLFSTLSNSDEGQPMKASPLCNGTTRYFTSRTYDWSHRKRAFQQFPSNSALHTR